MATCRKKKFTKKYAPIDPNQESIFGAHGEMPYAVEEGGEKVVGGTWRKFAQGDRVLAKDYADKEVGVGTVTEYNKDSPYMKVRIDGKDRANVFRKDKVFPVGHLP